MEDDLLWGCAHAKQQLHHHNYGLARQAHSPSWLLDITLLLLRWPDQPSMQTSVCLCMQDHHHRTLALVLSIPLGVGAILLAMLALLLVQRHRKRYIRSCVHCHYGGSVK